MDKRKIIKKAIKNKGKGGPGWGVDGRSKAGKALEKTARNDFIKDYKDVVPKETRVNDAYQNLADVAKRNSTPGSKSPPVWNPSPKAGVDLNKYIKPTKQLDTYKPMSEFKKFADPGKYEKPALNATKIKNVAGFSGAGALGVLGGATVAAASPALYGAHKLKQDINKETESTKIVGDLAERRAKQIKAKRGAKASPAPKAASSFPPGTKFGEGWGH